MLVRAKATVEGVGEAEELADIGRPHRIGAVIGALMEELERAHPGVSLLEHVLTIESKPMADRWRRRGPRPLSCAGSP